LGSKTFWVYGFYGLRFWTCNEDFRSQQEKKLLSGDNRAVFERVLHGEPLDERLKGSRFRVQRL
jgi:hypothetical protein